VYYMSTYAKVRRLFHRDHLSISEIQRRTSLSRNTIKAWLKETSPDGYKYPKRPTVNSKLRRLFLPCYWRWKLTHGVLSGIDAPP
jgi:transposase